jgi:DNA processing protein
MNIDELRSALALKMAFPYKPVLIIELINKAGSAIEFTNLSAESQHDILYSEFNQKTLPDFKDLLERADAELRWCIEKGINISYFRESDYPEQLLDIPDPPVVIFSYGSKPLCRDKIVSIVGTRRATLYGTTITKEIIYKMKESGLNPLIVSGLAFGIDVCAHKAALDCGLGTAAVLPGGMDNIYPATHKRFAARVASNGLLISDFTRGADPHKINFLSRNRIIAAISQATILVESGIKGGGLITARLAASYSRELFAVPGRLSDPLSEGCNSLITQNVAQQFFSVGEFAKIMNWTVNEHFPTQTQSLFDETNKVKQKILVSLNSNNELTMDQISEVTKEPVSRLAVHLLELELDGKILSFTGNRYRLNFRIR